MLYTLSKETICLLVCGTLVTKKPITNSGTNIGLRTTYYNTLRWSLLYSYRAHYSCVLCDIARLVQVGPVFIFL